MQCLRCKNIEVDASGVCPKCGYREEPLLPGPPANARPKAARSSMIELSYSERPRDAAPEDLPEWSRELARRLQGIKQKREGVTGVTLPAPAPVPVPAPAPQIAASLAAAATAAESSPSASPSVARANEEARALDRPRERPLRKRP